MSTTEWGSLRASPDWLGSRESDQESDEIELAESQEQLEYESYADSAMTIPGHGDSGPNCQQWQPIEYCDHCASLEWAKNHCERRACPHCSAIWEAQRTEGIVGRLAKGRYAEDDGIDRRLIHASVSAPPGEIKTIKQWYDGYQRAYELAQQQGIRGGVVIGHGFRVKDEIKQRYRQEVGDSGPGIWRWLQADLPGSWRDYTYWSPHYHVIGLCRDLADDQPEQQDGWTVRRLRSLAPMYGATDENAVEDMVRAVRYILDHLTFEAGTSKDAVRWYGELATSKFRAEEHMSDGVISAIERTVEKVVGAGVGDDQADGPGEDRECDECGSSSFSSIYDAGLALQDRQWCEQIGPEKQRRLQAAFEWQIGERLPPPGARKPKTKTEAQESLEQLLSQR
jgi:hypothetical protein